MTYRLEATAYNTHPESYNPVHSDEARSLGFESGVVPGVTLYGYFVSLLVEAWGEDWLDHGSVAVKFAKPVYDGEAIMCLLDSWLDSEVEMLTMLNSDRRSAVVGLARKVVAGDPPSIADFPARPRPDVREVAAVGTTGEDVPLVEVEVDTSESGQSHWLRRADNLRSPFDRLIHPVVMARVTSDLVDECYEVRGGRLLTHLRTTHYGTRPLESVIRARGLIKRAWSERDRDHMSVELLLVDEADRAVMHVETQSTFNIGVEADE